MQKRSFFSQLWLRLKADTPSFFDNISNVGKALSGFFTALLLIPGIPEILKHISAYALTGAGVMSILPLLVVKNGLPIVFKDPSLSKEEIIEKANEPAEL